MLTRNFFFIIVCFSFSFIQAETFNNLVYKNILKSISKDGSVVTFEDGLTFTINWWYQSVPKKWKENDQIYITFDFKYNQFKLQNASFEDIAWGKVKAYPFPNEIIRSIPNGSSNPDAYSQLILENGFVFRSMDEKAFGIHGWMVNDHIVILSSSPDLYQLWNIERSEILFARFIANNNQVARNPIEIEDIFGIEDRLNAKVLQQEQAVKALFDSLLNYRAGLNEKGRPMGVFLFLGPTGVGKTELAKVITEEIYKDPSRMLRFDMSHFNEPYSITRLIGSPPGYVNHDESGQLTGPLKKNSQMVVLLDELEKAHPQVIKTFLPVFDEGFILDTKNDLIHCSDTIFIMTSNLFGTEIAQLYNLGYSSDEILEMIEPGLMDVLSPELYNRVEPILFKPLAKETMSALVDLILEKVKNKLLLERGIKIRLDKSLKSFLEENGYHPLLGARPLKKLIEKRVLTALAYSIVKEEIEDGMELTLIYDEESDSVTVVVDSLAKSL